MIEVNVGDQRVFVIAALIFGSSVAASVRNSDTNDLAAGGFQLLNLFHRRLHVSRIGGTHRLTEIGASPPDLDRPCLNLPCFFLVICISVSACRVDLRSVSRVLTLVALFITVRQLPTSDAKRAASSATTSREERLDAVINTIGCQAVPFAQQILRSCSMYQLANPSTLRKHEPGVGQGFPMAGTESSPSCSLLPRSPGKRTFFAVFRMSSVSNGFAKRALTTAAEMPSRQPFGRLHSPARPSRRSPRSRHPSLPAATHPCRSARRSVQDHRHPKADAASVPHGSGTIETPHWS